jgi:putative membrane protein
MTAWSLASWSWQPGVLISIGAILGAYLLGLQRFRPQTLWQEYVVSKRKLVCFGSGVLLLVIALVSPLDTLSNGMFVAHMFQHMLLVYLAPPLLLLGTPAWLVEPFLTVRFVKPILRFLTRPVQATIIFNGVLILWHMPGPWDFALVDQNIHALEHVMFFVGGIISWWPVFSPTPEVPALPYPLQMAYLFVQSLVPAIIGAFLTFSGVVIYPVYLETTKLWGLSPLVDQQLAGLEMKLLGTVVLWVLASIRFFQWYRQEEHQDEKLIDDATH